MYMNADNVDGSALARGINPNEAVLEGIARMCHEANRAYCQSMGDNSQVSWEQAPDWQKDSVRKGIALYLNNPKASPEDSHESWYKEKQATGWVYGATKDPDKKTHPCMVAYKELPYEQQMKDSIFGGVARGMLAKAIDSGKLVVGDRPMTDGEEVMNVQFSPGGNPAVNRIRRSFADLHDQLVAESDKHHLVILNREKDPVVANKVRNRMGRSMALALTNIETAQMYAVKAVTR